jgi:hypothetical protein
MSRACFFVLMLLGPACVAAHRASSEPEDSGELVTPTAPAAQDPVGPAPLGGFTGPTADTGAHTVDPGSLFDTWPAAPALSGVSVMANRDSVRITVPAVPGAVEYRAFALENGTQLRVFAGGGEGLVNATVYCAGLVQSSRPQADVPQQATREIEVFDVGSPKNLVVEAVDALCPYVGVMDTGDSSLSTSVDAVAQGADAAGVPLRTEATIRAAYDGSLYVNGQAGGATVGAPASAAGHPHVLARALVQVTPQGRSATGFEQFDDFSDDGDAFQAVAPPEKTVAIMQNSKWNFFLYSTSPKIQAAALIHRGQLSLTLADDGQENFMFGVLGSKKPTTLSDSKFLHVTFESHTLTTDRRYLIAAVCGHPTPGRTFGADGKLAVAPLWVSDFSHAGSTSAFPDDWSCFQLAENEGSYSDLPAFQRPIYSSIRTFLNRPGNSTTWPIAPPKPGAQEAVWRAWYAAVGPGGLELPIPAIESDLSVARRVKHDLYLSKTQFVLFIDGAQRACSKFANAPLTMSDATVLVGQVLYHTTAEHAEHVVASSAQYHLNQNATWAETRSWDNVGYNAFESLPAAYDDANCFVENYTD